MSAPFPMPAQAGDAATLVSSRADVARAPEPARSGAHSALAQPIPSGAAFCCSVLTPGAPDGAFADANDARSGSRPEAEFTDEGRRVPGASGTDPAFSPCESATGAPAAFGTGLQDLVDVPPVQRGPNRSGGVPP